MPLVTHLTVTGGDGDPERTGYWTVTGPQDPSELYAIVERAWIGIGEDAHLAFYWYLRQRRTQRNASASHTVTIENGESVTLDDAVEQLRMVWPVRYVAPEPVTERMRPLVPRSET